MYLFLSKTTISLHCRVGWSLFWYKSSDMTVGHVGHIIGGKDPILSDGCNSISLVSWTKIGLIPPFSPPPKFLWKLKWRVFALFVLYNESITYSSGQVLRVVREEILYPTLNSNTRGRLGFLTYVPIMLKCTSPHSFFLSKKALPLRSF